MTPALERSCRRARGTAGCGGQSAVEYLVVTAALALALVIGAPSPLESVFRAFADGYQKFTYSISRP